MPIKVQNDLPAKAELENENIFVMDEKRATSQNIRPLKIALLNLMPLKEQTELDILRSLSNTPLQVDVTFLVPSTHESKNASVKHLNRFYQNFDEVKEARFDGLIITGAPLENLEFEEVDFWDEMCEIMDWSRDHVTSTIYLCWAAQAGLYHHYKIEKHRLSSKLFGVFNHKVLDRKVPLLRGFDDEFLMPHSRHTEIDIEKAENDPRIKILAKSNEAGVGLAMADNGREIYILGHPEYERHTLDAEYKRDKDKGLEIDLPKNYYPDDNPANSPLLTWRAHSNNIYTNWLNYYVYQITRYNLYGAPTTFHSSY